jgi:hypothetical protein
VLEAVSRQWPELRGLWKDVGGARDDKRPPRGDTARARPDRAVGVLEGRPPAGRSARHLEQRVPDGGFPGRLVHGLGSSSVRSLERAGVPQSSGMKLTWRLTEFVYRRSAIVSETDLTEVVRRLAAFQHRQSCEAGGPTPPTGERAQFQHNPHAGGRSGQPRHPGTENTATRIHDLSGTPATALSPTALPATVPLDHAHWKLNPPSLPSTSRISPQR